MLTVLADDGSNGIGLAVAVVIVAVVVLLFVLFLAALVSILRSPLEPALKLVWIVGCLFFQFFGPLLWFTLGRSMAARNNYPRL